MKRNLKEYIPVVVDLLCWNINGMTAKEMANAFSQINSDVILSTSDIRYILEKAMTDGKPISKVYGGTRYPKYEILRGLNP